MVQRLIRSCSMLKISAENERFKTKVENSARIKFFATYEATLTDLIWNVQWTAHAMSSVCIETNAVQSRAHFA